MVTPKKQQQSKTEADKKIKKPTSIKIGGDVWRIEYVKYEESVEPQCRGKCYSDDERIVLLELKDSVVGKSLLHEIIHALALAAGFDLEEEKTVSLENGLWQVIIDNRSVIEWMMKSGAKDV